MHPPRHDDRRYASPHFHSHSISGSATTAGAGYGIAPRPSSATPTATSMFHHLPPPIPSAGSPMSNSFGGSPSFRDAPTGGLTDPQGWVGGGDKPGSSRGRSGWNVGSTASPRLSDSNHGHRLPSLSDLPTRRPASSAWDAPSPTSHSPHQSGRSSFHNYGSSAFRFSPPRPPPLITPTSNGSGDLQHTSLRRTSESPRDDMSRRPSTSRDNSDQRVVTPAASATASTSAKHAQADVDNSSQKKKKRRVALSCAECAKRKQKCNRETPCQHCVARRVPELCVPYTRPGSPQSRTVKSEKDKDKEQDGPAGKASPRAKEDGVQAKKDEGAGASVTARPASMLPTISVRVHRLEQLLNAVVNRVDGVEGKALNEWRINHPPATSPPPLEITTLRRETASTRDDNQDRDPGEPPDTASTRSRRRDASPEWMEDPAEPDENVVGGLDRDTSARNPIPQSMIHADGPVPLNLDYHGTPAEQLQKLFEDCGVSPHKINELMSELPLREFAERLVDWFFQKVNFVRYPIDEYLFRQAFDVVYANSANVSSIIALPLVFIVMALAIRVAPDELMGTEEQKRTMSLRMYWNSKTAVIMASAVKAENLQLVETRILTGLFLVLMHERRLAEGWAEFRSALTVGQAIGLHRDGTKLGLDPYITEYRRRLWSYLVHADATYSCLLGRPTSINPACVDTLPPSNIELSDILQDKDAEPKPISEPTFATYLILREKLGVLVAKVTQHFQSLQGESQYRDIERLDAEFKAFVNDLPPAYRMLTPDKSRDSELWWLVIHRYYIQTEVLHFTIILHRPWLLRKLRSQRYALSRTACFDAALTDYKLRQVFKQECPDFFETLVGGSFREFNAAMIAGIGLIIDPRAPRASDMRQMVQSFMQLHPHDSRTDNFSQKEAAIIHLLWHRAAEMDSKRSRRQSARMPRDITSYERGGPPPIPKQQDATQGQGRAQSVPMAKGDSSDTIDGTPSSAAQSYVRGEYGTGGQRYNGMGGAAGGGAGGEAGMIPEEDHPQKLLDHWLSSNTSFGPGADSTINPYTGVMQYPTPSPFMTYAQPSNIPFQNPNHNHNQGTTYYDPSQPQPPLAAVTAGVSGWMDQSILNPATATNANTMIDLGANLGAGAGAGLGGVGRPNANANAVGGVGVGYGDDGNSAQYWNALIDGIVGGLPAYDPTLHTS